MTDDKLSFVVSLGHGEYTVSEVQNVEEGLVVSTIEDCTVEVLRAALSGDFSDIYGWKDAVLDDTTVSIDGEDYDLAWEWFQHWYGPREFIADGLRQLIGELENGPTGADDDTFDYWPSGVRLAMQIADKLGDDWPRAVELMARNAILSSRPQFADELLNSVGLEKMKPMEEQPKED